MINFKNVTYKIDDKTILDNVSFDINENEKVLIVGQSGSGKTSIFNMIVKYIKPTSGKVLFNNIDINSFSKNKLQEYRKNKISIIYQVDNLINNKTVLENLLIYYKYEDVNNMLNKTKLNYLKNKTINTLSGGERQKVAIIKELLSNNDVILADEITSSLDKDSSKNVIEFLYTYFNDKTIVFISHDIDIFKEKVNKIINIDKGKIISIKELKQIHSLINCKNKTIKNHDFYVVNKLSKKTFSISTILVLLIFISCLFVCFNFTNICNYFAKVSYTKYFNYDVLFIKENSLLISDDKDIFVDISNELNKAEIIVDGINIINKNVLPFNNQNDYSKIVINTMLLQRLNLPYVEKVNIKYNNVSYTFTDIDIVDENNTFTVPTIYYDFRFFNNLLNIDSDNLIYINKEYKFDDRFTNNPMYEDKKENKPYLDSYAYQDYLTYLSLFDSLKSIVDYFVFIIVAYCIITAVLINFSILYKDSKKIAILLSKGIKDRYILLFYLLPTLIVSIIFIICALFIKSMFIPTIVALILQILTVLISYYLLKSKSLYKLLKEEYLS